MIEAKKKQSVLSALEHIGLYALTMCGVLLVVIASVDAFVN